ncbi:DUF1835 domain-containing protein [Vibrio parahaemolyticus]|uniref:DUF1835 domain-containing protein n=1 Tax=Vibrio parahaemolyticus TaxID=670 RepID=UPI000411346B|nr:DUF1835 domain-containing protein [Vibrio parahaemolyticus]EIF8962500.1 DUF1835 domain-containing protein [Vibrio parahaemolyticus]EIO4087352.1 DUF1835 domain-containing protein [Vibrio parahaemolyticus]TOL13572.1 DUF1835 domain-containing protein [Vibrio parahaemolyticus]TOL57686.1 DUF1835 domain-containing protein [Vibrio parahaemolyticus]TOL86061.1 DUF1835 domain-containing protein [Vibrio parahaemolyticus]
MNSTNSFSININQQKSIAKKRLKAIRLYDDATLELVKRCHSKPESLTPNTIQLADVQHALARELGLSSWSKLKAHVEELEAHKRAIKEQKPPLDAKVKTLHVRCGHNIQQQLKASGFEGTFLALIDPLCIGPIPATPQNFLAIRAQYVVETLLPVMKREDSVQDIVTLEQSNLDLLQSDVFERIVFWVEHDSYDQLMLIRALTQLENVENKVIEIIELNQFPGTERFIGFGQLPEEAIRSCWRYRKPVSAKLLSQAKQCWQAVSCSSPKAIVSLIDQHQLDCLPNMSDVLRRLLQELPHTNSGLSMTQQLALNILSSQRSPVSVTEWFKRYQQIEPLPFLGDVMFYALLFPLTQSEVPLFAIDSLEKNWWEQKVTLTEFGKACLAGQKRAKQCYWVGGMRISEHNHWRWDHQRISSLSHYKKS